ncbi:MAG: AMP-dependent synthetase/ligase [Pirellulales bacterium]
MRNWLLEDDWLITQLLTHASASGDRPALWCRESGETIWRVRTWGQIATDVARVTDALGELGVGPQSVVAQWAGNDYAWILLDLALLGIGALHVPLHATLSGTAIAAQLRHSGASLLVTREGVRTEDGSTCRRLAAAELLARGDADRGRARLAELSRQLTWDTPAALLYTSGTLGAPKGVVLTQGNLLANTRSVLQAFVERETERRLSLLPFSHIYAHTCDLLVWLLGGTEMAIAGGADRWSSDLRDVSPTLINGVPLLFERFRRALSECGAADRPGALRAALGGRIEVCVCGGAAVPDGLDDFFTSQGVPLLPGYGLTEASPVVTASTVGARQRGAVGRPLPGVEVRLAEDGEILTRGPHVMSGYFRDAAATAEALREGWLHTGDLGVWTDEGLLRVTGRKKEVVVLAQGKNVSPAAIEQRLLEDPWIAQVAVLGDGRPCLVALIVLRTEVAAAAAENATAAAEPWESPAVARQLAERVAARLSDLASHEQVRGLILLDRAFSVELGECTPKLTLCRPRIAAHFVSAADQLYQTLTSQGHADRPRTLTWRTKA